MSVLLAPLFPALTALRSSSGIRASSCGHTLNFRGFIVVTVSCVLLSLLFLGGCVVPTAPVAVPAAPTPAEIAKQQRLERALINLADGMKRYDAGAYEESMSKFLLALDSGVLTTAQQITARKQIAFIHCVSNREAACKEEFEKIIALDPKFDLPAAEAGHPTWGPAFRNVKSEIESRKTSRATAAPATATPASVAEKLMAEGAAAYDLADFNKAIKAYLDALKEKITVDQQIISRKFIAFSYCLSNRAGLCRVEFDKILLLKPNFELAPAEAGHPSWGPSFRTAKAKQKAASLLPTNTPPAKK